MPYSLYNQDAPKKAANLSVNSDLLRLARDARINLSRVLEAELIELLRNEHERQWREENREAIADYNHRIETAGSFSDGLRRF